MVLEPTRPPVMGDVARLAGVSHQTVSRVVNGHPPVSYTHLRAHETVLDLVCRLLLATKTTSTPLISITPTHTAYIKLAHNPH